MQNQNQTIIISQPELTQSLLSYYTNLRSNHLPSLNHQIPQQFASIQKQIIGIVQLRKNMEKVLEEEVLQSQHYQTISKLVDHNLQLEKTVDEVTDHLELLEKQAATTFVKYLKSQQNQQKQRDQNVIDKGERLLLQLSDFKRTFKIIEQQSSRTIHEQKVSDGEDYLQDLIKSQHERQKLIRHMYTVRMNEVNLREQLIEQKQRVYQDLSLSNCELIDTLLKQKEKDKNLRKKQNQKFGQIIKQRDQIDLQNENLNHSQKGLIAHLQSQLLRLKNKIKEQDEKVLVQNEINNKIKVQELQHQIQLTRAAEQKINFLNTKVLQLQKKLSIKNQQYDSIKKNLEQKQIEHKNQFQKIRVKYQQSIKQNNELIARNEQLQSQYNEQILRSSQLNHIKSSLTQKLQKSEKYQQISQELKANVDKLNSKMKQVQQKYVTLLNQSQRYKSRNHLLETQLAISNQALNFSQKRVESLEEELTKIFINNNNQRNIFIQQIQEKTIIIDNLNDRIQKISQMQSKNRQPQKNEDYSEELKILKQEIQNQIERGELIKFNLIDRFVDKINQLIE